MTPALASLLLLLIQEAPSLAVKLLSIWHQQGKITAEEIAEFLATKWPDAESFFRPAPPVTP